MTHFSSGGTDPAVCRVLMLFSYIHGTIPAWPRYTSISGMLQIPRNYLHPFCGPLSVVTWKSMPFPYPWRFCFTGGDRTLPPASSSILQVRKINQKFARITEALHLYRYSYPDLPSIFPSRPFKSPAFGPVWYRWKI